MLAELYIENELVELDDSVKFSLTKQFEDITDPTTIINDWSKTVSIPFSVKNNKLFGHLYNPDRVTVDYNNLISSIALQKYDETGSLSWDDKSGTIEYSGNTNQLSSISGYIYDINTSASTPVISSVTAQKYYTMSVSKDDDNNAFKLVFNSSPDSSFVILNMEDLDNGRYTLSFYLSKLDTTNDEAILRNLVLVSGNTAVLGEDAYHLKGVHFNPLKKINFRLEWDKSVLMEGYAKMNDVRYVEGKGTYNITLFGELGKVFSEMKKITFDTSSEDTEYIIPKGTYANGVMDRSLVMASWYNDQQYSDIQDSNSFINIMGFAPSIGYNPNFDSKSLQTNPTTGSTEVITQISDYLSSTASTINYSTIVGDGLLPRQIGEFRSYYQLPYVYFNKLFQMFKLKFEEISDYKIDLDSNWFNTTNPYWYRLIYMLKPINTDEERTNTNTYTMTGYQKMSWDVPNWTTESSTRYTLNSSNEKVNILDNSGGVMRFKIGNDYGVNLVGTLPIVPYYPIQQTDPYLNPENALLTTLRFTGSNGTVKNYKILMKSTNCTIDFPAGYADYTYEVSPQGTALPYIGATERGWVLNHPLNVFLARGKYGDYVTMTVSCQWYNTNTPVLTSNVEVKLPQASISAYVNYDIKRSFTDITFNDFWDNNYNLFEEILKYCKRFRILVKVDPYTKTVKFIHAPNYFSSYTISDWTDKLDRSHDYVIKPVTFEDKYILFNYSDTDIERNSVYNEKYGYNYGEIRLETDYNFSDEVKYMFSDTNNVSIVATENVLDLNHIEDSSFLYQFSVIEYFIDNKDQNSNPVSIFGSYFFRDGRYAYDSDLIAPRITDDTDLQQNINTYCYLDRDLEAAPYSSPAYFPRISTVYDTRGVHFNKPLEYYTYTNQYSGTTRDIYQSIWRNYLDERYYENNKLITCYLNLEPKDYISFDFNHFIKIDNQLYMINKIYDYDATTDEPTKVDLITIHRTSGYTT